MRSLPWVWTIGSATPYWLMRFSMMVRMSASASGVTGDVVGRQRAVLAAQTALQVEAETRVDRRAADRSKAGSSGRKFDRERGKANHQDENGEEATHSGGTITSRLERACKAV